MDLPLKQVKPREIAVFVDNFRRLLIKPALFNVFCEPSDSATSANLGIFRELEPI